MIKLLSVGYWYSILNLKSVWSRMWAYFNWTFSIIWYIRAQFWYSCHICGCLQCIVWYTCKMQQHLRILAYDWWTKMFLWQQWLMLFLRMQNGVLSIYYFGYVLVGLSAWTRSSNTKCFAYIWQYGLIVQSGNVSPISILRGMLRYCWSKSTRILSQLQAHTNAAKPYCQVGWVVLLYITRV